MGFKKVETEFEGLVILEPDVFGDHRGYFLETYNAVALAELGFVHEFVQDNLSFSRKGILRGLHFQAPPFAQGKLVSVLRGEVLDIAVDIRQSSPTYGKVFEVVLSEENHKMAYIPPGFAHGFIVRSDECLFSYKCTNYYNREAENGLMWNDPMFDIQWGDESPLLSDKDKVYAPFAEFVSPFA